MDLGPDRIILIARSLGFSSVGVVDLDQPAVLDRPIQHMQDWLSQDYAGEMDYLKRHLPLKANPHLVLGNHAGPDCELDPHLASGPQVKERHPSPKPCLRAIVVGMNYLPKGAADADWRTAQEHAIADASRAVVSSYAWGRDYHRVLRLRLAELARELGGAAHHAYRFRACVDSAPVMEVEMARLAGLGWRGKHTLLLNRNQGSMFFLGVLLTDMPIEPFLAEHDQANSQDGHCGSCTSCMQACPTQAFVGPYQLDARRCISYLTIELKGSIPTELRPLIGNRVYGCDDCQRVCPWNRYAQCASLPDFDVRNGLDGASLVELFSWTEQEFEERHRGSAILRIGYERWLRNLAVAMGNALGNPSLDAQARNAILQALIDKQDHPLALVREHVRWAISASVEHAEPDGDGGH